MRTDCTIEEEEVVAVVLEDVASVITSSCTEVKVCLEAAGMGWCRNIGNDFLRPNAKTTKISRGPNGIKRKCFAAKLSALPPDMGLQLKNGKLIIIANIAYAVLLMLVYMHLLITVTKQYTVDPHAEKRGRYASTHFDMVFQYRLIIVSQVNPEQPPMDPEQPPVVQEQLSPAPKGMCMYTPQHKVSHCSPPAASPMDDIDETFEWS